MWKFLRYSSSWIMSLKLQYQCQVHTWLPVDISDQGVSLYLLQLQVCQSSRRGKISFFDKKKTLVFLFFLNQCYDQENFLTLTVFRSIQFCNFGYSTQTIQIRVARNHSPEITKNRTENLNNYFFSNCTHSILSTRKVHFLLIPSNPKWGYKDDQFSTRSLSL